jgi:hypothetical protein
LEELQKIWGLDFPSSLQRLMNELAEGKWRAIEGDKFIPLGQILPCVIFVLFSGLC